MNGDQFPNHLWFLHESYYGLFNSQCVIMRDSDLSSVFYILYSMEKYHAARPFEYWITYEGDDKFGAKKIIEEYQNNVQFWDDENVNVASYVKNI